MCFPVPTLRPYFTILSPFQSPLPTVYSCSGCTQIYIIILCHITAVKGGKYSWERTCCLILVCILERLCDPLCLSLCPALSIIVLYSKMIKGFLSTTLTAGRWVSSLINCSQDFFWFSCNTWSLIGSSKIRITMILIFSYMNRSRWQVPTPFYFVFSKPLDRWFTYSLSQILFLLIGDRIKNNISNLQEKGLGYLSQEVLYLWQIWKQSISELTVSRDYVLNLQGDYSQYLEDVSLCGEWAVCLFRFLEMKTI